MPRFFIDEDLPTSLLSALRARGFDVTNVREAGLRGASDDIIFRHALDEGRTLVTKDLGFGLRYERAHGEHPGLILVRIPSHVPVDRLVKIILDAVQSLSEEVLERTQVVVEPDKVRLRRS